MRAKILETEESRHSDRPHSTMGNKQAVSNNDNQSHYDYLTLSGAWLFARV